MTARPMAEHEIQRILALVPWLVAHPGALKSDVAERFGISTKQLERDLDLVLMIGVPPYSPADYIDVDAEGETVTIRMADSFRRPLRLSHHEGLALLAAARTLLAVPGSDTAGPLATATDKLAAALGDPDISVVLEAPAHLSVLRDCAARGLSVAIDYWTQSRDEVTTRTIDPYVVYFALGEWYADAYCHRAAEQRTFRIDRVLAATPTTQHFDVPDDWAPRAEPYAGRDTDPLVEIELAASARWVCEHYPVESVDDAPDGRLRVTLRVSEASFLEGLAIRLGPQMRVVGAPPEGFSVKRVARALLGRYGATSP